MNICVFCGSSDGSKSKYRDSATALGITLANRHMGLVYGGASIGLMGATADAALEHGGIAIGVIPEALAELEIAHQNLTELHIVQSMHERKALMADRADAFIALPGGIGTLEETFEVWTWTQLGLHTKPLGLLNVDGYFDHLLAFLDHQVAEGFVKPAHRELLCTSQNPDTLLDQLQSVQLPKTPKIL